MCTKNFSRIDGFRETDRDEWRQTQKEGGTGDKEGEQADTITHL